MINADPQELAKFSDLAHRWWDEHSEFKPLHRINPLRLEWIERSVGGRSGPAGRVGGGGGGVRCESIGRGGGATGGGQAHAAKPQGGGPRRGGGCFSDSDSSPSSGRPSCR